MTSRSETAEQVPVHEIAQIEIRLLPLCSVEKSMPNEKAATFVGTIVPEVYGPPEAIAVAGGVM